MNSTSISGEIVSLAFGGQGILRHQGKVVFVPYTAPGDQISCQIVRQHPNYSEAKLLSIDHPSSLRIEPKCPYFGKCGGCQLQHLDYSEQLKYKQQTVLDALTRIGKLKNVNLDPIVPAEMRWAYRRHITLTLKEQNGKFLLGYIADDQRSLLTITQCPIFVDPADPVLGHIQELVHQFEAAAENEGKLVVQKMGKEYFLQWHFKKMPSNARNAIQQALHMHTNWVGSSIATPESEYHFSDKDLQLTLEGLNIRFSPRAFLQNHPEQSLNIYKLIQTLAEGHKALDFYCGIGITSLLLARQGMTVKGVESNREAVKMARDNSERNGLKASFECTDVKKVAKKLLETERPDLVIVNPPRIGLEPEVVAAFQGFKPRKLIYISCMPSTLARDLQRFIQYGFKLDKCQPFDMFPQTGHVETVAVLKYLK